MFPGGDMETGGELRVNHQTLCVTVILPQIIWDKWLSTDTKHCIKNEKNENKKSFLGALKF